MKKTIENIYLKLGEIIIKVNFCETSFIYAREKLQKEIFYHCTHLFIPPQGEKIDFSIDIVWDERPEFIYGQKEKKYFNKLVLRQNSKKFVTFYHIGILQFLGLISNIYQHLMVKRDGFMIHLASALVDGKASLFVGDSGAGKSTIVGLINKQFPTLSDDRGIIRKKNHPFLFYQLPFIEFGSEKKVILPFPIGNIYFLHKASFCKARKIMKKEYIAELINKQLIYIGDSKKEQIRTIRTAFNFISRHNDFYNLYFTKDRDDIIHLIKN